MTDNTNDPDQLRLDDGFTSEWRVEVAFRTERPFDDDDLDEILGALRAVYGSSVMMTPGGHDGSTVLSFWADSGAEAAGEAVAFVEWALSPILGRVTVTRAEPTLVNAWSGPDDDPIRVALRALEADRAAEARGEVPVLDDGLRAAFIRARGGFDPAFPEVKRQRIRAVWVEDADILEAVADTGWEPGRPFIGGGDEDEDGDEFDGGNEDENLS
ncbi:hypothetical protein ACFWGD_11020 [Corynebacterium sp. NPDC060344]|uniref:hypothetical protein n=1 Tax=Corynebacterium sp. NPDC060344 TaxID=3347101 RepID=UPI00364E4AEE